MPRDLSASVEAEIAAANAGASFRFAGLVELEFEGAVRRIATIGHTIQWDGKTWEPAHGHLQVGPIQDTDDKQAQGVELALGAVDQTIIGEILATNWLARKVSIYWLLFDDDGALVPSPYPVFIGRMTESWSIEETPAVDAEGDPIAGTITVSTRITSELADRGRDTSLRSNVTSHGRVAPGDTFFQNVPKMMNREIEWGGKK